eukprot:1236262-Ditylum_brightwellii.AAC.1
MTAINYTMNNVPMKCCDAVMAVQNGAGQTRLLEVWRDVYLPNLTDDEAMVNHHMLREAGWQVDCIAKWHRGSQCFWSPNGDGIPLDYDANKY